MIRWILAHGGDEDKEVDAPETTDEIVILKYEQWPGRAQYLSLVDEHDDLDDTVITFARAGSDDLLGEELTLVAAMAMMHSVEGDGVLWYHLSRGGQRAYIKHAQAMLAAVQERINEKRQERGQLEDA